MTIAASLSKNVLQVALKHGLPRKSNMQQLVVFWLRKWFRNWVAHRHWIVI